MRFLKRAWEYQTEFENRLKSCWKRVKARRKQRNEGRELPDLKDIAIVRNYIVIAMFSCLIPGSINVFTHWFDFENSPCYTKYGLHIPFCEDPPRPWYAGMEVYGWFLFMMLGVFLFVFDYSLWKRGGPSWSLVDWGFS